MVRLKVCISLGLYLLSLLLLTATSSSAEGAGVVVRLEDYEGPATVVQEPVSRYKVKLEVDPKTETEALLLLRVELPTTGREAWPVADVEVRDARGRALAARRSGIEWHKLLIALPAVRDTYFVQAIDSPRNQSPQSREAQRLLPSSDPALATSRSGCPAGPTRNCTISR